MSQKLNALISRHTTQWFHRVQNDEISPALAIREIASYFLQCLKQRKLSLTISETSFRRYICEFICTYYVAHKRGTDWNGPTSEQPRPRGWTQRHQQEWEEYLHFFHFSPEFWYGFWAQFPEALWETRILRWRDAFEYVVLHYINVQPDTINMQSEEEKEDLPYSDED